MIDLERLAREAGITERMHLLAADFGGSKRLATDEQLQRFAQLVAEEAARIERERCGEMVSEEQFYPNQPECRTVNPILHRIMKRISNGTTLDQLRQEVQRSAFGIDATKEQA